MKSTILAALIASATAMPALAETTVRLEVFDRKEMIADTGETEIVYTPIETAVPGDRVTYRITLKNTDNVPATSVGMTLPVDPSILVEPLSISGDAPIEALFSIDGGEQFSPFSELVVKTETGLRPATPDDLTHMRIGLEKIPANTEISVEYAASVE